MEKYILIHYVSSVTPKSVKTLYLIINKINGCEEESNGKKYLTLVPADDVKDTLKKYEELLSEIIDLMRSITNN